MVTVAAKQELCIVVAAEGLGTFRTEAAFSLSATVCSLDLPLWISEAAEMPPFNFS